MEVLTLTSDNDESDTGKICHLRSIGYFLVLVYVTEISYPACILNGSFQNKGYTFLWLLMALRFLYNRLALVSHCDSHLSSMTLPWQLLSVINVVLFC